MKVTCKKDNFTFEGFMGILSHMSQLCMAFTFQFNFFSFYKSLDVKRGQNADDAMLAVTKRG